MIESFRSFIYGKDFNNFIKIDKKLLEDLDEITYNCLDKYENKAKSLRFDDLKNSKSSEFFSFLNLDIVGSTKKIVSSNRENMFQVVNAILLIVKKVSEYYGGNVLKYLGDGIIIYFDNDKIDDSIENSVISSIIVCRYLTTSFTQILKSKNLEDLLLKVKIGIDCGFATKEKVLIKEGDVQNESLDLLSKHLHLSDKIRKVSKENSVCISHRVWSKLNPNLKKAFKKNKTITYSNKKTFTFNLVKFRA